MAHCNTTLNQLAAFFPRHDFEKLASKYHHGQKIRSFNRWSQFLARMIAQLTGRKSLRDLVGNITAQGKRIYHLGMKSTTRATLARVNDQQLSDLYKELFFSDAAAMPGTSTETSVHIQGQDLSPGRHNHQTLPRHLPLGDFSPNKGAVKLH